jgi:hypothetical protein
LLFVACYKKSDDSLLLDDSLLVDTTRSHHGAIP